MKNFFGNRLKLLGKRLLFPGLDLHTRCRYRFLPRYFQPGPISTLDVGCGNGALSYAAYKLGNSVVGVTNNPDQVSKVCALFSALGLDGDRFRFEVCDIRDLIRLNRKFNQIICSETLEHIRQDDVVIRDFYNLLRPGGILHLSCPFRLHPEHNFGRTGVPEDGRHVRDGYTLESYRSLLEPAGFKIVKSVGLGSPALVRLDKFTRRIRNKAGDMLALPFFLLTWPLQALDFTDPNVPYSLYVKAVKSI